MLLKIVRYVIENCEIRYWKLWDMLLEIVRYVIEKNFQMTIIINVKTKWIISREQTNNVNSDRKSSLHITEVRYDSCNKDTKD